MNAYQLAKAIEDTDKPEVPVWFYGKGGRMYKVLVVAVDGDGHVALAADMQDILDLNLGLAD